jgi:hypothetical protein
LDWIATLEKRFVCLAAKVSISQHALALVVLEVSDQKTAEFEEVGKALKAMAHTGLVVSMLFGRGDLCQDRRLVRRGQDAVQRVGRCYMGSCCVELWVGILDVFLASELSFVVVVSLVGVFVSVLA